MDNLIDNISDFIHLHNGTGSPKTICVYGDLMLDIYDQVKVNRISPEAAIPVIDCNPEGKECIMRPGGAGNTLSQLSNFNVTTHLFSFINDETQTALAKQKFDLSACLKIPSCIVPTKKRYYDDDHPLCRMDYEKPNYGLSDWEAGKFREDLFNRFIRFVEINKDITLILSDYNKGVFDQDLVTNRIMPFCSEKGIITIVDPKKNPHQWHRCTIFKPNVIEAATFLHSDVSWVIAHKRETVARIQELNDSRSVVVTNGGKGVFGTNSKGNYFDYTPEKTAGDVRSVIGAGDCFAAILALCISHKYDLEDAVSVAYEAAAVYVQKKHNEPIWPHELLARVEPSSAKILNPTEMAKVCKEYKDKKKIVLTNGCYDIIHSAHIATLEFAKQQGDILIAALNTDTSISRLKGSTRPINCLHDRRIVIAALDCVDFVTYFEEDTPAQLISMLQPDVIVKGSEYAVKEVVGHETCKVVLAPMTEGVSTTKIIERIKKS